MDIHYIRNIMSFIPLVQIINTPINTHISSNSESFIDLVLLSLNIDVVKFEVYNTIDISELYHLLKHVRRVIANLSVK